jgi:rod shape determining protein RodA
LLILFIFALSSLILLFFLGDTRSGATRWFSVGGFGFQPSEFVKIAFLLYFSYLFANRFEFTWRFYGYAAILTLLVFGSVALQPDLDNAVTFVVVFGMFFLYSMKSLRKVSLIALVVFFMFAAMMPVVWENLRGYQKERILTFLQPARDPLGAGYHASQALITVGSGQVWGRGLGNGTQFRNNFLPEHTTDFAFASFAEEFGFAGSTLIILLYLMILSRLIYRISHAQDRFYEFALFGVSIFLFMHAFTNIGMNLGLLPVMGITLPFFSFGGSSIISFFVLFGIVQSEKSAIVGVKNGDITLA